MKEPLKKTENETEIRESALLEEDLGFTEEDEAVARENTYVEAEGKSRKKRKFGKRELLLIGIPALAALLAVLAASFFVDRASEKVTSNEVGRQYYMGAVNTIEPGAAVKSSEDGKAYVKKGDSMVELAELPVYYDNRQAFMVTQDMIWFEPRSDSYSKVDRFTELSLDSGSVTATYDGVKKDLLKGFLYNGSNMFVFLEAMTISTGGYDIELPALSYAEAVSGDSLLLFNYETKESESFDVDMTAAANGPVYSIELFTHTLILPDGTRALLFTNPEKMESMFLPEQ